MNKLSIYCKIHVTKCLKLNCPEKDIYNGHSGVDRDDKVKERKRKITKREWEGWRRITKIKENERGYK